MEHLGFELAISPPEDQAHPSWWFLFRRYKLLVELNETSAHIPLINHPRELGLVPLRTQYLGRLKGQHCYSAEIKEGEEVPDRWSFQGLRRLFGLLPDDLYSIAGAAVQIVDWDRNHQYCGHCGNQTYSKNYERAKECPNCGLVSFPRISPAVIVLVQRDDQLLLARSLRHPSNMYSVLAGFVEPGETLEEAVVREIREEVGLEIKNLRYFGSQPWPYPNSLMIAFTCEYSEGEIILAVDEMADAGWYRIDELPRIPPPISIARQLIDWFVAKQS
jgi:NAD+ diphosphatase